MTPSSASPMHAGEVRHPAPTEKHRDIPSLDGLRALSILSVVLSHSNWFLPPVLAHSNLFHLTIANSRNGVTTFFVISGFLITNLLLREFKKTGGIALGRFYFRRSMRIFPAFYLFLLVVGLLMWRHLLPRINPKSFLASATYTWCYYPQATGYFLQHSWSLSIEEQFYLLWPALVLLLHGRKLLIRASVALVVLMPLLRVLSYFLFPSLRGYDYYLIYGWLDTMMVGCLLALLNCQDGFGRWKARFLNWRTALGMAVVAFYLNPALLAALPKPYVGLYALLLYPFVTAVCIAGVLLFVVEYPKSLGGRFLNLAWLRWIGVLSYSLYLWQQIFVSEHLHLMPFGYVFLLLASLGSYWLVEQPFLRLRTRIERRRVAAAA
ncbi:acyltransferase family protein [Tunturiibacter gelidoferens]|uniref:Peptidoglycan/LPS O-acetylase OafA/YrhL n=1 Tax=Tunturiibacter gelidiferens TaxID=3069689 RepID=A0A9X0QK17_9BACT|nr:acyltransferase [Edaphobacter lichenicola]MBB5331665.1 peptidoglycan/LPS O-acetylase OafA/YrhL [Edaphobacter lichenicola]